MASYQTPENAIYQFLDTNGNGTGTKNANGDYSSAADEFYFQPSDECIIYRMVISITDTAGMTAAEYGNLGSALSNGYDILAVHNGNTQCNLSGGVKVTDNAGLSRMSYDVQVLSWGTTPDNETAACRFTFANAGQPLYLRNTDWRISITLNDNLTGLLGHYFMVQGYYL